MSSPDNSFLLKIVRYFMKLMSNSTKYLKFCKKKVQINQWLFKRYNYQMGPISRRVNHIFSISSFCYSTQINFIIIALLNQLLTKPWNYFVPSLIKSWETIWHLYILFHFLTCSQIGLLNGCMVMIVEKFCLNQSKPMNYL